MEEERNYCVYIHIFPNGKKYIGITCQKTERRWRTNGEGYKGQPVYNAIKKYGWDNIEHKILFENLTEIEACWKEKFLIKYYNTTNINFGYNIQYGGNIYKMNFYTKEIIRLKSKLRMKENKYNYKKVICENKIFNSIEEFKKYYNIQKYSHVGEWLNRSRKMPKKWFKMGLKFLEKDSKIKVSNYELNDGLIFYDNKYYFSLKEISNYINVPISTINCWLLGRAKMPIKYYNKGLKYVNNNNNNNNNNNVKSTDKGKHGEIKIICDDIIFNSIKECADYYNVTKQSISKYLKGIEPMPIKFYDMGLRYKNETLEERNKRIKKQVKIDGIVFDSIYSLSNYLNISPTTIGIYLNGKNKMPKKWKDRGLAYYEENEN